MNRLLEKSSPAVSEQGSIGYQTVSVGTLKAMEGPALDLYLVSGDIGHPILYCSHESPPTREELDRLVQNGVDTLLVPSANWCHYCQQLEDQLPEIVNCESIPPLDRFEILHNAVSQNCRNIFETRQAEEVVAKANQASEQISHLLLRPEITPRRIFDLVNHDFCTFSHSLNVACYSVLLADALSIRDQEDLKAIAVGAMLHDLGKRSVDKRILKKPGPLTCEEKEAIRRHPQMGFEELYGCEGLSPSQLMMVYQHHERIDGRGYPVQITAEEIEPWAKMCAVADIFDALTAMRPYRRREPVERGLALIEEISDSHLDGEMAQCWINMIRER